MRQAAGAHIGHAHTIERKDSRNPLSSKRAVCQCGWISQWRETGREATQSGGGHVRAMQRKH
jgi:hypothetical protein